MSGASGGRTRVSYRTDTWHVWRTLPGNGEFRSSRAPLTLILPQGRVTYRGTLRSMAPISKTTHRITVNKVRLEAYVRGVVPREMPSTWHRAALRAQAVAARTYAAFEVGNSYDPRFNLCDSASCQVYGGLSAETSSTNAAVGATDGQVRTSQGKPAFTQFSSSDGGWTADGGQPYLPAQRDPYDGWSGNHHHSWTTRVDPAKIAKKFGLGTLQSISVLDRDGNGEWGGRVGHLQLVGTKKSVTVTGDAFRIALGLQSTWFDVAVAGG
jgi:SpoIID/LytB domain protein